jgi:hypothetical protein
MKITSFLLLFVFALVAIGCNNSDGGPGATNAPTDSAANKAIAAEQSGKSPEEISKDIEAPANPMLEPNNEQAPSNP